jgi:hypothetical protein
MDLQLEVVAVQALTIQLHKQVQQAVVMVEA